MTAAAQAGYRVQLDVFEGPLDLLLHLVKKHELDIFDIPIAFITEKYLAYLDLMTSLNLDVAGEYLLMAATLAHIKSRELLPAPPPGTSDEEEADQAEEEDPRQELIRRLLEYQKYKEAAESLGQRPVVGRNVWTRGAPQEDVLAENVDPDVRPPLKEIPVIALVEALDRALSRAKIRLSHEVSVDRLSVSERINQLADRLEREGSFTFQSCFRFLVQEMSMAQARHEAVVTFLAVLEMARLGLIRVWQELGPPTRGDDGGEEPGDYEDEIVIGRAAPSPDAAEAARADGGAGSGPAALDRPEPAIPPLPDIDDEYR
ncbi:MAG TPA: segregation/condensation protein A [Kofleriaceae bacterium]|nr:segregation/condensation protein A [Kofleriaceae bacterium]